MRGTTPHRDPSDIPVHPTLWALAGMMLIVHLIQMAAEIGLVNPIFLPYSVYGLLGFFGADFNALLAGQPASIQLWWSFITHGFVHGSWLHLGMNAAIFLAIGHMITRSAGIGYLLIVFFCSVVAGAIAHGLLAGHQGVLIGASGGVFGQLAVMVVWRAGALQRGGFSLGPIWRLLIALIAMNVLQAFALSETMTAGEGSSIGLAWEAHLGGFIAGALVALFLRPRPR